MDADKLFKEYGYFVEFVFSTKEDIDISNIFANCFARFLQRELLNNK